MSLYLYTALCNPPCNNDGVCTAKDNCMCKSGYTGSTCDLSKLNSDIKYQVKTQYLHFGFHANYFLLHWKIPEEISRRSMFFHNERQYLPH